MLAGDGETNLAFLWTSRDGAASPHTIPSPVIGLARKIIDQLIFGGDPHGVRFEITYADCKYDCYVREDQVGGYKIFIQSTCGKVGYFFLFRTAEGTPSGEYWAHFLDNQRQEVGVGNRVASYNTPTEVENAASQTNITGLGAIELPSMYTGLVRSGVQVSHFRGENSPFSRTLDYHHHIVEYPQVRVGSPPAPGQFFLAELRVTTTQVTAYFYPINGPQSVGSEWKIAGLFQTTPGFKYNLMAEAGVPSVTKSITPNVTAIGLTNAYGDGWASSYSGHEAQALVQHVSNGNSARLRVVFTLTPNPMATFGFDFDITVTNVEQITGHSTTYERYFKASDTPFRYERAGFPRHQASPTGIGNAFPVRIWYDGDVLMKAMHHHRSGGTVVESYSASSSGSTSAAVGVHSYTAQVCGQPFIANVNYTQYTELPYGQTGQARTSTKYGGFSLIREGFGSLFPEKRTTVWSSRGRKESAPGPSVAHTGLGCSGTLNLSNSCDGAGCGRGASYSLSTLTCLMTRQRVYATTTYNDGVGHESVRVVAPWYEREGIIFGQGIEFARTDFSTTYGPSRWDGTSGCVYTKTGESGFDVPPCTSTVVFPDVIQATVNFVQRSNTVGSDCASEPSPPNGTLGDYEIRSRFVMWQRGRTVLDNEYVRNAATAGDAYAVVSAPDVYHAAAFWNRTTGAAITTTPTDVKIPLAMCGNAEFYEDASLDPTLQDMNCMVVCPSGNWRDIDTTETNAADVLDWFASHIQVFDADQLPNPPTLSGANQGYLQPIAWAGWVGRI